jgi:hypothetical protein
VASGEVQGQGDTISASTSTSRQHISPVRLPYPFRTRASNVGLTCSF